MPGFNFRAMDERGRIVSNRMDANNLDDLESRLSNMELDLINCGEVTTKSTRISGKKIPRQEMITFCFHLEQVLGSGVPLLEGLSDLRDSSDNPLMQALVAALVEDISTGTALSQAMEKFPQVFDEVFTSLIRAGEQTGNLQIIFSNMAETIKWQDEIAAKTKKMMMYPSMVLVLVLGIFFFMMIFLVPQLVSFIKEMGMELPIYTVALINTSDFVLKYWLLILGVPIAAFFGISFAIRINSTARYMFDWVKLHIWLFGPIVEKSIMARFTNTFSMMYGAGITVLDCLVVCEKVVGNKVLSKVIEDVQEMISDGESISSSFKKTMVFPPLVLRMLAVGESTGALDKSLMNVRYFYDREVKDSVEKLQGAIEPILTVFVGALMVWIILSVLAPVYEVMSKVG
ncbi:MAG: type II secretion system F family protein [Magnetococcales bacterium]|nr:type II secretion system F family protein [Magnetococcales bacterium]